jgi:hypothetical protein
MTGRVSGRLRIKDGVGLVETGVDGASRSVDVMVIDRLGDLGDIAALGLTLAQGKQGAWQGVGADQAAMAGAGT